MYAGEKEFTLEEKLNLPVSAETAARLIRYDLQADLLEQKVMSDKVVFRGTALIHALYQSEDGILHSMDAEIPFSQFEELDREYGENAKTDVMLQVTGLEAETEDGKLAVKAGITAQYLILDEAELETVADLYSPLRPARPIMQQLTIPSLTDSRKITLRLTQTLPELPARMADTALFLEQPQLIRGDNGWQACTEGQFCGLYYDETDTLHRVTVPWEEKIPIPSDETEVPGVLVFPSGRPQTAAGENFGSYQSELILSANMQSENGTETAAGAEIGEKAEEEENGPGLVICRPGKESLWELAKKYRSTPEAIRDANHLNGEPEGNSCILIPVN